MSSWQEYTTTRIRYFCHEFPFSTWHFSHSKVILSVRPFQLSLQVFCLRGKLQGKKVSIIRGKKYYHSIQRNSFCALRGIWNFLDIFFSLLFLLHKRLTRITAGNGNNARFGEVMCTRVHLPNVSVHVTKDRKMLPGKWNIYEATKSGLHCILGRSTRNAISTALIFIIPSPR